MVFRCTRVVKLATTLRRARCSRGEETEVVAHHLGLLTPSIEGRVSLILQLATMPAISIRRSNRSRPLVLRQTLSSSDLAQTATPLLLPTNKASTYSRTMPNNQVELRPLRQASLLASKQKLRWLPQAPGLHPLVHVPLQAKLQTLHSASALPLPCPHL